MEAFDEAVRARVVCGGVDMVNAEEGHAVLEKGALELTALVCRDARGTAVAGDPSGNEGAGYGLRRDVADGDGLGPAGVAVDYGKEVALISRWWQRAHKVDVDVAEAIFRRGKMARRRLGMTGDFALLASSAKSGPAADIGVYTGPDVTRA